MKHAAVLMIVFTALAACGADGEPVRPSVNAGVSVTPSGVYPSASVGVSKGPLSVFLGL
jgi:hypothetical protein